VTAYHPHSGKDADSHHQQFLWQSQSIHLSSPSRPSYPYGQWCKLHHWALLLPTRQAS
jgi:hypothetical protein